MWIINKLEECIDIIIVYLKLDRIIDFIKWIISLPKEIEFVKNDPFIEIWKTNYTANIKSGIFRTTTIIDSLETKFGMLLKDIPIILLADGPSLDDDIKIIKKISHKFFIICQDAVLYNCIKNKIKPNLVVSLDPSILIKYFWHDFDTSDITLAASTSLHPDALKAWKGRILFYNQSDSIRYKDFLLKKMTWRTRKYPYLLNKGFVGNTMFQIAVLLDPAMVILSGYDLAYTNGKYYCKYYLERRAKALGVKKKDIIKAEVKKEKEFFNLTTKEVTYTSRVFDYYHFMLTYMIFDVSIPVATTSLKGIIQNLQLIDLHYFYEYLMDK